MVQVTFTDSNKITYDDHAFYQYDFGQELVISGLTLPPTVQVHFARKNVPALINIGTTVDGVMTVLVPAETLKYEGEFNVYIYVSNETSGQTYKTITFYTRAREMPGDYAVPDEPDVIQVLMNKLDQIIATGIADYQPHIDTVNGMIAEYVPANLIVNNDAATVPGKALDAVRGKALRDDVTALKISDTKDNTVSFAEATIEADIVTGEKHSTAWGKIVKSIKTFRSAIGTLTALPTTNKTSIVGAITEINNNLANIGANGASIIMSANIGNATYSSSVALPGASTHVITITKVAIAGVRVLDLSEYAGKLIAVKYTHAFRVNTIDAALLAAIANKMLDIEYTVS